MKTVYTSILAGAFFLLYGAALPAQPTQTFNPATSSVYVLAASPDGDGGTNVFAGTFAGVFRCTDGGGDGTASDTDLTNADIRPSLVRGAIICEWTRDHFDVPKTDIRGSHAVANTAPAGFRADALTGLDSSVMRGGNTIYMQIATIAVVGNGSVNFEKMLTDNLSVRMGLGVGYAIYGRDFSRRTTAIGSTGMLNFLTGGSDHKFEFGAGASLVVPMQSDRLKWMGYNLPRDA